MTDLVQRHARVAVGLVERDGAQQTGAQRRAQHVLVGNEWVGDPQHLAFQPCPAQLVDGQERRWHHLGDAQPQEHLANLPAAQLDGAEVAVQRRQRHALGDVVVAVVPRHLLDDVDLRCRIGAPARQLDGEGLWVIAGHRESDRVEQAGHLGAGEVDADDPVDLADPHPRMPRLGRQ